jgi:DNA-binding Lrp family transcriptional regulator
MRRGFIQFPRSLIDDYPPQELGMMMKLFGLAAFRDGFERRIDGVAYLNDVGEFTASIRFLAEMLGVKKGQAERLMKKLVRLGVLKKTKTRNASETLSETANRTPYGTAPTTYMVSVDAGLEEVEQSPSGQLPGQSSGLQWRQNRIKKEKIKKKEYSPFIPHDEEDEKTLLPSPEAEKLAKWFRSEMHPQSTPPSDWFAQWSEVFETILVKESVKPNRIKEVCRWAMKDKFWCTRFIYPSDLLRKTSNGLTWFAHMSNKRWADPKRPLTGEDHAQGF